MNKGNYYKMQKTNNVGEIYIYGDIVSEKVKDSDVSATGFMEELKNLGDVSEINVRINSGGGSLFAGNAIYTMLKNHKATVNVYIESLAASIASVIAMSGDRVYISSNSMLMIHNAFANFVGNSNDMRKMADDLEKMNNTVRQAYMGRTLNVTEDEVINLMNAETWMTAKEALAYGFVDEITASVNVAAYITQEQIEAYQNTPKTLENDVDESSQLSHATIDKDTFDKALNELREQIKAITPKETEQVARVNNTFTNLFLKLN